MRAGSEHETSTRGSPAEVTGHIYVSVSYICVMCHGRTLTSYCSPITSSLSAITSYCSPITSYLLAITRYCSPSYGRKDFN